MEKVRYCASCRNGGGKEPADYKVRGRIWLDNERSIPYNGFLCKDHLLAMIEDGNDLRVIDWVGEERDRHASELVYLHTMYYGLKDFLNPSHNPTIRPKSFEGAEWLRRYYREKTGRYPQK